MIEVDVDQIQALSIDALRKRWRTVFGATPPRALSKDIIARLIAYCVEEEWQPRSGNNQATGSVGQRRTAGRSTLAREGVAQY
jgi:hypothetical protein